MRTAKYHDHIVLKVALFAIVIVLGLFVYLKFVKASSEHVAAENAWEIVEATCTKDGYRYKVCTECGEHFDKEVIKAKGTHTPMAAAKENIKHHDDKMGGSYDLVIHCKDCDEIIDSETIYIDGGKHNAKIVSVKENEVASTCTVKGSYDLVDCCEECGYVFENTRKTYEVDYFHDYPTVYEEEIISRPDCTKAGSHYLISYCSHCEAELEREIITDKAYGHDYTTLKAEYNRDTEEIKVTVYCSRDGHAHVLGEEDGVSITLDENTPVCVSVVYNITGNYKGFEIDETVEFAPYAHSVYYSYVVDNSILNSSYPLPGAKYDNIFGYYYDLGDNLPGINYYDVESNHWSEYGFAKGVYYCVNCETYYIVQIYSSKYDTRINY